MTQKSGDQVSQTRKLTRPIAEILLFLFVLTACSIGTENRFRKVQPGVNPTADPTKTLTAEELPGVTPLDELISLPPGFTINIFAQDLTEPRMMAIGPDGELYLAERGKGRILRLPDENNDGEADRLQVVAGGLDAPSSLAFFKDGSLFVGETTHIWRLSRLIEDGSFQLREAVIADLPEGGHSTRTIIFSPDWSKLYVSIGSSCNACYESDPRRATIMEYNLDGSAGRVYARGLRNAVGLAFRSGTDELWATNNGRDMMGDDLPPDTIQQIFPGLDYGWPHCHGGWVTDKELGGSGGCKGVAPANTLLQAHSAPLGLTFYSGSQFPTEYQGNIFVALHGSWNRSVPTGYKIVRIPLKGDQTGTVVDFADGWLHGDTAWGRPVDVITARDGSLLVSDDARGIIYRISYRDQEK